MFTHGWDGIQAEIWVNESVLGRDSMNGRPQWGIDRNRDLFRGISFWDSVSSHPSRLPLSCPHWSFRLNHRHCTYSVVRAAGQLYARTQNGRWYWDSRYYSTMHRDKMFNFRAKNILQTHSIFVICQITTVYNNRVGWNTSHTGLAVVIRPDLRVSLINCAKHPIQMGQMVYFYHFHCMNIL